MEEDHGRLAQGEPQRVHQLKDLGVDEERDEEADPAGAVGRGVAADLVRVSVRVRDRVGVRVRARVAVRVRVRGGRRPRR